jgi:hypothetical protein
MVHEQMQDLIRRQRGALLCLGVVERCWAGEVDNLNLRRYGKRRVNGSRAFDKCDRGDRSRGRGDFSGEVVGILNRRNCRRARHGYYSVLELTVWNTHTFSILRSIRSF